jgi:hypothetical protein
VRCSRTKLLETDPLKNIQFFVVQASCLLNNKDRQDAPQDRIIYFLVFS